MLEYMMDYMMNGDKRMCDGLDWPYPRIDLKINFYLDQVISNPQFIKNGSYNDKMPSTFSYIFKGCFPSNTESKNVKHSVPSPGQYIRGVTFQYNNAICIPNAILNKFYGTDIYTLDKYKKQQQQQMQLNWKKNAENAKEELDKIDAHYENKKVARSLKYNDKRVKNQIKDMRLSSDLLLDTTSSNNISSLRAQQAVVLDRAQNDNYEQ